MNGYVFKTPQLIAIKKTWELKGTAGEQARAIIKTNPEYEVVKNPKLYRKALKKAFREDMEIAKGAEKLSLREVETEIKMLLGM